MRRIIRRIRALVIWLLTPVVLAHRARRAIRRNINTARRVLQRPAVLQSGFRPAAAGTPTGVVETKALQREQTVSREPGQPPLSICLLSRKNLLRNTRVVRQAEALARTGRGVAVACYRRPHRELIKGLNGVSFIEVPLQTVREDVHNGDILLLRNEEIYGAIPLLPGFIRLLLAVTANRKARDKERNDGETQSKGSRNNGVRSWIVQSLLSRHRRFLLARCDKIVGALPESVASRNGRRILQILHTLGDAEFWAVVSQLNKRIDHDLAFAVKTLTSLDKTDIAYVQAHDYVSLIPACAVAEYLGADLVYDAVEISEHRAIETTDIPSDELHRENILRLLEHSILAHAAGLLTVGQMLSEWYRDRYEIAAPTVLRNCRNFTGVDGQSTLRKDCGVNTDMPVVLWMGGGYPKQGLSFLLKTFAGVKGPAHLALLVEFMPKWKPYEKELHKLAKKLGVAGRLSFLPLQPPNSLINYISAADIGVIPRPVDDVLNVKFSLPNKLFEMIMSRLVVATTSLPEIVRTLEETGTGGVLEYGDPKASARVIEMLIEKRRRGEYDALLEAAARRLSWEKESKKLIDFYHVLAHGSLPVGNSQLQVDAKASA